MEYIEKGFVVLVALEHVYILLLEMFFWTTPKGMKAFGMTKEFAESTKVLAANQGVYNGFLASGLLWGVFHNNSDVGVQIQVFFLSCVLVAALYGGATAKKTILLIQGLPALIAMFVLLFFGG